MAWKKKGNPGCGCCEPPMECVFVCDGTLPEVCGFRVGTVYGDIVWYNEVLGEITPFVWTPVMGQDACEISSSSYNHLTCEYQSLYHNESKICTNANYIFYADIDGTWYVVYKTISDVDVTVRITNVMGVSKISATLNVSFIQRYSASQGLWWLADGTTHMRSARLPGETDVYEYTCTFGSQEICSDDVDGILVDSTLVVSTAHNTYLPEDPIELVSCDDILNTILLNFDYTDSPDYTTFYIAVNPAFTTGIGTCTTAAGTGADFYNCGSIPAGRWYTNIITPQNATIELELGVCQFEVQLLVCPPPP